MSGKKGVVQTFAQCAKLCEKIKGCKAIELWHKYNWNCYLCKRIDLIGPYFCLFITNKATAYLKISYHLRRIVCRKIKSPFTIL